MGVHVDFTHAFHSFAATFFRCLSPELLSNAQLEAPESCLLSASVPVSSTLLSNSTLTGRWWGAVHDRILRIVEKFVAATFGPIHNHLTIMEAHAQISLKVSTPGNKAHRVIRVVVGGAAHQLCAWQRSVLSEARRIKRSHSGPVRS